MMLMYNSKVAFSLQNTYNHVDGQHTTLYNHANELANYFTYGMELKLIHTPILGSLSFTL